MKKVRHKPAEGITLADAYQDLTREAFAVWVRMMVEPETVLEGTGINKLSKTFQYGRRSFWTILQQLRNKGYIRFATPAPGSPAAIHITKRPMLVGRDHFLKLS